MANLPSRQRRKLGVELDDEPPVQIRPPKSSRSHRRTHSLRSKTGTTTRRGKKPPATKP